MISTSRDVVKCADCGRSSRCSSMNGYKGTWYRSVKRKYDEFEEGNRFFVPGLDLHMNPRVEVENECVALREMVSNQQQAIQDLYSELEEERNASSSAANEAMSMILRLQREKAEIQMESRQFKRFAEEKMAHDQQELLAFEDVLYKRDQAIQALTCEVQAYKHRMLSYGLTESEIEGDKGKLSRNQSIADSQYDLPVYDYPPLRCIINENMADSDVTDVEKYAFGETPRTFGESPCSFTSPRSQNLKNLEFRIHQMERTPSQNQLDGDFLSGKNILEKVIVGYSPRRPRHNRMFSTDSTGSHWGGGPDVIPESPFKKVEPVEEYSNLRKMDNISETGDDMSDRVYTIDSVHNGVKPEILTNSKAVFGATDDYDTSPRVFVDVDQPDFDDPDIKKLYMRLQALEADRESMRQTILSMRTDKAQMVLLKEIAQHLCNEVAPERKLPLSKPSVLRSFSFVSVFKVNF